MLSQLLFKSAALLVIFSCTLKAQSPPETKTEGMVLHASLIGAIKYPGLNMGADYLLLTKNIDKQKKRGRHKRITKNRFMTANLGFYYHGGYNTNTFLLLGYQLQRCNARGWQWQFEPRLGLSRTFINVPVYEVDDQGNVSTRRFAGDFYLAPALSGGVGKDFSVKHTGSPLAVFIKATLYTNYPYNNFIYGRVMFEAGLYYKLHTLMPHAVTVKNKTK